jgi:nitrile hydratase beta subunit
MNGVHDMGGMHGLGPLPLEADEPLFHAAWEARVLALTIAIGALGRWNIDASRHQRELIPGPDYLRMSYYERWLSALLEQIASAGLASRTELASSKPDPGAVKATPRLTAEWVPIVLTKRGSYAREIERAPRFEVGALVRVRNFNPSGHTRAPRYVRGKLGTVTRSHAAHVFPDSHAHGRGEDPQHLYGVRFSARELWGDQASERDCVHVDLWEPYLEQA